jgi:hypothetical protein
MYPNEQFELPQSTHLGVMADFQLLGDRFHR